MPDYYYDDETGRMHKVEVADESVASEPHKLLPCPFCGGSVRLEEAKPARDQRMWWGVVCRNTVNRGGTCAIQQIPSASKEAAIARWNMRGGKAG